MKKQLLRISDYTIYGFQYVAVYFFRGFTSVTVAMALTVQGSHRSLWHSDHIWKAVTLEVHLEDGRDQYANTVLL